MSGVPTSTSLTESAVIKAPLSDVWHLIKLPSFAQWLSTLKSSEVVKGVSEETDVVKFEYTDGTVQEIKQEEHSSLTHSISFSTISSNPPTSYTSSLSTIRLFGITSGQEAGGTYVEWSGWFSGDASADVIQDAVYKRRDALADLAKAATKNK